ncbi:MAG: response regulator [Candidatus Limivivens sp.]|nr:response regulator [Candidatus Limivivens sp.]
MYQAVIVDDEPFVVEGIKTAIDWSGFNFELSLCTTDPCQALEFCENHPVDLLVTDISMPQLDGIELIRRVREANPLTSILVLSAYDNFEYVRSAMRHGAENYLLKPLDPDELMESISRIAGHIHERFELSGTYGSTMLTFRSNFIENWVKGSLSEDEFLTRAQMLGVNLYLNNYTVFLFSAPPSLYQGKEKMSLLFDYLLSLLVGNYISHFYFESPTTLVCIISSADPARPVKNLLVQLEKARYKLNFPYFTSVGITADNYEDVSTSYRSASKFLFLQYSSLTGIVAEDLDLTMAAASTIERDYLKVSCDLYLQQLHRLFLSLPESRYRAFVLTVLNWGIFQTSPEEIPEDSLVGLLKELPAPGTGQEAVLSYLDTFVSACYSIHAKKQAAQTATYPYVDTVIEAVHDFSDKDISLKTLAARLNMHPSYLGNIFHQQTGYYFSDYLNEERLKYAAGLMKDTDMKLKDIVDRAGFSSQTYFNRQFRRKYGVSPNVYRREVKFKN